MNDKTTNRKVYTLKPPLKVKCAGCNNEMTVLFCPPRQDHSKKNNLGYWSGKEEYLGKYECDDCLVDMYRNRKFEYLGMITDSKKRRLFRTYYAIQPKS
jgi:hypothetical protein